MADQFVKNEDGAESYGCTVNYIPHHPPELIIKANGREQERISLERFRNPNDIRRLMESKGFSQTDEYFKKQKDKRDVEFVAGQEADVYWLDGDGGKHHSGIAEVGAPLVVSTYVGHNFEVQDGFGDPIIMYTVSEKARQRVSIPAETPEL